MGFRHFRHGGRYRRCASSGREPGVLSIGSSRRRARGARSESSARGRRGRRAVSPPRRSPFSVPCGQALRGPDRRSRSVDRASLRGPAGGAPLHRRAHPRRRHRSGRGVSALRRRAGRALHPGGDARARRHCRQREPLGHGSSLPRPRCRAGGSSSAGHHEPRCSSTLPENCGGRGRLVDKVATAFTSSQTGHGVQESTTLAVNETLCNPGATTQRRPGQQDEAIERYRLRSNQPGSRH
jgi:hypothetical protein